jgi:probable addiction module antidote protein
MKSLELIVTPQQLIELNQAAKQFDTKELLMKMKEIIKSNKFGFTILSKKTGLTREHLYKIFGPKGNPQLLTVFRIAKAMGLHIDAVNKDGVSIFEVVNKFYTSLNVASEKTSKDDAVL